MTVDTKFSFGSEKDNRLASFLAGTLLLFSPVLVPRVRCTSCSLLVLSLMLPILCQSQESFQPTPTVFLKQAVQKTIAAYGSYSAITDFLLIIVYMEVLQLLNRWHLLQSRDTVCCGAFLHTLLILYSSTSDGNI